MGSVKGGQIVGQFPDFEDSNMVLSRGRLIPTLSWDHLFDVVSQWMGLTEEVERDYVTPNRGQWKNHPQFPLLELNEIFRT